MEVYVNNSVLQEIGVRGWAALEPVVVAALATEATLLLVGPHGTAKSMVLERLAAAMELECRYYNASTIQLR